MIDVFENFYKKEYERLIDNGEGFHNYEILANFVLKLLGSGEEGRSYILKIEDVLLNKGLIRKRIEKRKDFIKNRREDGDFNRLLFYISQIRDPLNSKK